MFEGLKKRALKWEDLSFNEETVQAFLKNSSKKLKIDVEPGDYKI